jgi:hypothetical protein
VQGGCFVWGIPLLNVGHSKRHIVRQYVGQFQQNKKKNIAEK